jgi:hypothetical protein
MARSARDQVFETLRASGVRRRTAKILSEAAGAGRAGAGKSQEVARGVIADLRSAADDVEARITGRSSASDRSEAAQKAARTRERNAKARSASAKKAAATRKAKSSGSGTTAKAKSTASRAKSTAAGGARRTRAAARS